MSKKKDNEEIMTEDVLISGNENSTPVQLYKYDIGDTVYVMENNKVKEFVIAKRVVLTVEGNDKGNLINEVYYDDSNVRSLRGAYQEEQLYASKKALLASL